MGSAGSFLSSAASSRPSSAAIYGYLGGASSSSGASGSPEKIYGDHHHEFNEHTSSESSDLHSSECHAVPKYGVKLSYFEDFVNHSGGIEAFVGLTTSDVYERVVKPATRRKRISYCDMLRRANHPAVGIAQVFISHAWGSMFLDVYKAIQDYLCDGSMDICVWFDLFSVNQHLTQSYTTDWWATTYKHALERVGQTVMVFDRWSDPKPLKRIRCLYELYVTINASAPTHHGSGGYKSCINGDCQGPVSGSATTTAGSSPAKSPTSVVSTPVAKGNGLSNGTSGNSGSSGMSNSGPSNHLVPTVPTTATCGPPSNKPSTSSTCRFDIALCHEERQKLIADLCRDPEAVLQQLHQSIDMKNSDSYRIEDKRRISELVVRMGGFRKVNEAIFSHLRDWLITLLEKELAIVIAIRGDRDRQQQQSQSKQPLPSRPHRQSRNGMTPTSGRDDSIRSRNSGHSISSDDDNNCSSIRGRSGSTSGHIVHCINNNDDISFTLTDIDNNNNNNNKSSKTIERENKRIQIILSISYLYVHKHDYNKAESLLHYLLLSKQQGLLCVPTAIEQPLQLSSESFIKQQQTQPLSFDIYCNVLYRLGNIYLEQGQYDKSQEYLLLCYHERKTRLSENHRDVLQCMHSLGTLYLEHGHSISMNKEITGEGDDMKEQEIQSLYQQAEEMLQTCLIKRQQGLGEDSVEVIETLNTLALLYYIQEKYNEAEPIYQDCLQRRKIQLGENHPDTLSSLHELAMLYCNKCMYSKAEQLLSQCYYKKVQRLGEDHPRTLSSMFNLASIYYIQGAYDKAEPLLVTCLEEQRAVFGSHAIETTVRTLYRLGTLYLKQGENTWKDAEKLLNECLHRRREYLGDNHIDTIDTIYHLAQVYSKLGVFSESETLFLECWNIQKIIYGIDNPKTLRTEYELACLYDQEGMYDKAEVLYNDCLQRRKIVLGEDNCDTLRVIDNLEVMKSSQDSVLVIDDFMTNRGGYM